MHGGEDRGMERCKYVYIERWEGVDSLRIITLVFIDLILYNEEDDQCNESNNNDYNHNQNERILFRSNLHSS